MMAMAIVEYPTWFALAITVLAGSLALELARMALRHMPEDWKLPTGQQLAERLVQVLDLGKQVSRIGEAADRAPSLLSGRIRLVTFSPIGSRYRRGKRVVELAPPVFRRRSVNAVAVAAHEVGHARQPGEVWELKRQHFWGLMVWLGGLLAFVASPRLAEVPILSWLAWGGAVLMASTSVLYEADASRRGLASLKQLAVLPSHQQRLASLVLAFIVVGYCWYGFAAIALTAVVPFGPPLVEFLSNVPGWR